MTSFEDNHLSNHDQDNTNILHITVVYRDPPEIRLLAIQVSNINDHRMAYSKFKSQVCREYNLPKSTPFMLKDHVNGYKMNKDRFSEFLTSKQFPSVWKLVTQNVTPSNTLRDSISSSSSSTTTTPKLPKSDSLTQSFSQISHNSLKRVSSELIASPDDSTDRSYRSKFFAHHNSVTPTSSCTLLSVEYDHSSLGYNYRSPGGRPNDSALHGSLMTIDTFGNRGGFNSSQKASSRLCCELIHPDSKLVNLNWDMDANCYIMKTKIIYIPSLINSYNLSNNPDLARDITAILKDFGTKIVFFYEPNSNITGASSTISIPKPSPITQVSVGDLLLSVENIRVEDMTETELALHFEYPKEDLFPLFLEILLWTDMPQCIRNLITQSLREQPNTPQKKISMHSLTNKSNSFTDMMMSPKESAVSHSLNGGSFSPTRQLLPRNSPSPKKLFDTSLTITSPSRDLSSSLSASRTSNNKNSPSPRNSPIIKAFQLNRPRSSTSDSKKHSRSDSFKFIPTNSEQQTMENILISPIKSYMKPNFDSIPEQSTEPKLRVQCHEVETTPKLETSANTFLDLPDLSTDNDLENTLTSDISPSTFEDVYLSQNVDNTNGPSMATISNFTLNSAATNNSTNISSDAGDEPKGGTLKAKLKRNCSFEKEKSNEEINELTSPVEEKFFDDRYKFPSEDNIRGYNSDTTGKSDLVSGSRSSSSLCGNMTQEYNDQSKKADNIFHSPIRSDNRNQIYMEPIKITLEATTSPISDKMMPLTPSGLSNIAEFVNPSFQRLHGVYQSFDSLPRVELRGKFNNFRKSNSTTTRPEDTTPFDSDQTSDDSDNESGLNLSQNNYDRLSHGRHATRCDPRYRMSAIHVGLVTPVQKRKFPEHRGSTPGIFSAFEDEFALKHSSSDVSPHMAQSYIGSLNQRRSKRESQQANQSLGSQKFPLETTINPSYSVGNAIMQANTLGSIDTPITEDNASTLSNERKPRYSKSELPLELFKREEFSDSKLKDNSIRNGRQVSEFVHPAYKEQLRYNSNRKIGNMEISSKMHIKLVEKFQIVKVGPLSRKQEFDGRVNKKAQDRAWKAVFASINESDVYFYKNEKDMHLDQMQFTFSTAQDKSSEKNKTLYESIISVHHAKLYIPNDYMANKGRGTSYVFRIITENESSYLIRASSLPTMFGWILALYLAKELPPTNHPDSQGLIQEIERRRSGIEGANKLMKMVHQKMKSNKILFPRRESRELSGLLEQSTSPHHSLDTCPKSADNDKIPLLVETCIREIEERAIEAEGIYRVSGTSRHISSLRDEIHNKGILKFDIEDERWADENNIAGLLKLFFKELTCPIVTPDVYDSLIKAITKEFQSHASIIKSIQGLIHSLPEVNILTLDYLIAHIFRVSQHSNKNKMSVKNLSIVFGPTLITRRDITTIDLAKHNNSQVSIMEFLITYYEHIFNCQPIPEHLHISNQHPRAVISRNKVSNSSIKGGLHSSERLRRVSSSDMPSNSLSPIPVSPPTSYTNDALHHLPLSAKLSRSWSEEVIAKPDFELEHEFTSSSVRIPTDKDPAHNLLHYCYKDNTDLNIVDSNDIHITCSDARSLLKARYSNKLTKSATSTSLQAYSNSLLQTHKYRDDIVAELFFKRSANTPYSATDNDSNDTSPTTDTDSNILPYLTSNFTPTSGESETNIASATAVMPYEDLANTPRPCRKQGHFSNNNNNNNNNNCSLSHTTLFPSDIPPTDEHDT